MGKVEVLFIDDDERLCDACDVLKKCASIKDVGGNVMVICKDCLNLILSKF